MRKNKFWNDLYVSTNWAFQFIVKRPSIFMIELSTIAERLFWAFKTAHFSSFRPVHVEASFLFELLGWPSVL